MPSTLPIITASYAALLTLMYMVLSINVTRARYRNRVSLLDGDKPDMRKNMRIHGNFSEYVPLALIVIFFAEIGGASLWTLHLLGSGLFLGRILHATGLKAQGPAGFGRKAGMYLTAAVMISGSIWILIYITLGIQ